MGTYIQRWTYLAHSLVMVVGYLCEVSLPEPGHEHLHGHEVQLAGLNAQTQAGLHGAGARGLQASLARGICMDTHSTIMEADMAGCILRGSKPESR